MYTEQNRTELLLHLNYYILVTLHTNTTIYNFGDKTGHTFIHVIARSTVCNCII